MPWRGPDGDDDPFPFPSLGWSLLDWWTEFLPSPADENKPLVFTDDQARLLIEWYAVDPLTGRFVYRRGATRGAKGKGKSPVEASKAIAELAGEVRFDGFDASGNPVGRPWGFKGDPPPWVQIAAVSEDQTENTYGALYEFLNANDGRAADALRIDLGLTRCYLRDRSGKLEPVTAAAGTREGQRVTYAVLDETHLWTPQNGGVKLARTLRRNVAKMRGRSYETTNSFAPGENSVAEGTHLAVIAGQSGVLYDAVEAPSVKPTDSDETLKSALKVAYGDAYWIDLDRLVQEIRDTDTPWEDSERYYFNHNVDDRQKAVSARDWDDLVKQGLMPPPGARIGVGFDGSISDDCTALIGTWYDEDGKPHTFEIEIWSRPERAPRGWRIPRTEVEDRVKETFEYYDVGLMLCDPARWQTDIERWISLYGEERVVFFDTNQPFRMWRACDRFSVAIDESAYSHDGSLVLTSHVVAMHKRKVRIRDADDDGRTKFVFVKGPNKDKIDAGIAAVLSLEAAATMPEKVETTLVPLVAWR